MKIVNILFNYKKSKNDNKILGVERCFIDQSQELIRNGNEVVVITKPDMVFAEPIRQIGARLIEVPAIGNADIFSILRIAFFFFFYRPDAVICHSGRALLFARVARFLSRRKFVIFGFDHGINPKKFLKADRVFTVNSFFSKELVKAGKREGTALVMPNMINVPKNFSPIIKPAFRKPLRLGSLGRLYPEKCFDRVIEAMAILRERGIECDYVIGGIGVEEQRLNELAKKLGFEKNFKILGWTDDKKTFFESIDIFMLPSLGETFGIVLLEAMLYSTPIITSNSWGPDDIITDGIDGLKVNKDPCEKMPPLIADAIERLVKDENFARGLAEKSYANFFKKYTADVVGKRFHDEIKKVVSVQTKGASCL